MGLTKSSTGFGTKNVFNKKSPEEKDIKTIALIGNPNVGKSTVFNTLTGMKQHTGNWPGKTIAVAEGYCEYENQKYKLVDLPGTYSLLAHSAEEEITRDFICFGKIDLALVVCDATCLERNLNLVLQTLEICKKTVVCINLLDEAKRKNIEIDFDVLEKSLGVPVVGVVAHKKKTLKLLMKTIKESIEKNSFNPTSINYEFSIKEACEKAEKALKETTEDSVNIKWLSVKLIENDDDTIKSIEENTNIDLKSDNLIKALKDSENVLKRFGISRQKAKDKIAYTFVKQAEETASQAILRKRSLFDKEAKIDKILTGRFTGLPIMLLLLALVFWITISGANYPSELLSSFFNKIECMLFDFSDKIGVPTLLQNLLIAGVYRVLTWVIAVMLPPMAIFFPLFTLLEDLGYLPRVAFNLDRFFQKCNSCGKQALTYCMSFGCNAAGIVGTRIIDSPRERLIAIITNNFIPCNGRFPMIISIISVFFIGTALSPFNSLISSAILASFIVFSIFMAMQISKLLSKTFLKGVPSSFVLELPPYRKPQLLKTIIRSLFDRTLFVLGRAVIVAAPAGLIIWCMANIHSGDRSLLIICSEFLEPFGKLMGMDGVILLAFILGFPANEIVIPIAAMTYLQNGMIEEIASNESLKEILVSNGWTPVTAVCVIIFTLMHWPCSTTCITIYQETKSFKWTMLSFLIPTVCGALICILINLVSKLLAI